MRRRLFIGLAVVGATVLLPAPVLHQVPLTLLDQHREDPRVKALQRFFEKADCPAEALAADFIQAADTHGLDWRLLPSISFVESSGGKAARNNNLFGWDNGRAEFASFSDGIHHVARRLANSSLYRDKNVDEVLETYNPASSYRTRVKSIMRRIAPSN